jgi:tetratricopeptide (TPR) repeat protein
VQRGRELLAEGKPDEALTTLASAIRVLEWKYVPPEERDAAARLKASAVSLLGEAAATTGDHELAREAFSSAVAEFAQLRDLTGEERTAYAVALDGSGRVVEAIEQQRRALDEGEESVAAVLRLARWLRNQGRLADAELELRRLSPRFPADPDIALELAEVLATLESPEAAQALADASMKLLGADRSAEALAALNRVVAEDWDNADIAKSRAVVLSAVGQDDQALEEFERAIELGGDEAELRAGRAMVLAGAGRKDEALAEIDRISEDVTQDPGLIGLRGFVFYTAGDYQAAARDLDRAFSADPTQIQVAILLGDALRQASRFPEARRVLDKAVEIAPELFLARARRGQVLLAQDELDQAIAELRCAVELDPEAAWVHAELGEALRRNGQLDAALESLDRCLQIEPGNAWAIGTRGQVLAALGRKPEAVAELRRAVELDKSLAWASAELGSVLRSIGRLEEALSALDEGLANQRREERLESGTRPDGRVTAGLLQVKAGVLSDQGNYADAVKALRAAVRLVRDDAALHAELAYGLQVLGAYKQALASANRAIKLEDGLALAWATKGAALAQLPDRHDEAVEALKTAMSLRQDDAWPMVVLAEIYKDDGELDKAERLFRAAIAVQRDYMSAQRDDLPAQREYIPAHRGLGDTLRLQGRNDEAYASLELAVALAPDDLLARRILGYALLGDNRLIDALTTFEGALEISPGDPVVTGDIIAVLTQLDNFKEALRRGRAAVRQHPDSLPLRLALGVVLCDVGEFEEATDLLRPAVKDAPDNADVSYWLGWALDNLDHKEYLEEARAALERALTIRSIPAYHIELANILRSLGDAAQAADNYAEAIAALDPNSSDPEELAFIGWCRYGLNEFDEAARQYRRSLWIAPKAVEVQFDLALVRLCQGRGELAADEYRNGLDQLQRRPRLRQRGLLRVALVDLWQGRRVLQLDGQAKTCEEMLRAALRSLDRARAQDAADDRAASAKVGGAVRPLVRLTAMDSWSRPDSSG